ncbi:MAG: LptA/OstA family protein [Phycisphaerae bacterium]
MKRRLLLLVGSFALVLLTFLVYQTFETGHDSSSRSRMPVTSRPADIPQPSPGPLEARTGTDLEVVDRDDQGRLRGVYTAERWEKLPDERYQLEQPKVTFYHAGGQQTIVSAREGLIDPQDVGGSLSVRTGRLSGDVRIYFDRSTEPDRSHPEQRPEEVVRVYTESITFDNELLEIHTDRRVSLYSAEADIFGRGLTIAWNEGIGEQSERELRLLRIDEGERLTVYTETSEISGISFDAPEDQQQPKPRTQPTTTQAAQTRPAMPAAQTRPTTAAVETQPTTLPARSQPATAPVQTQPVPRDKARNIYRAVFHAGERGDVRVTSGDGSIEGARELSITFQWEGGIEGMNPDRPGRGPSRESERTTTTQPTQPAQQDEPAQPLEVLWSGPLVITPQGYTPTPSSERYTIEADGEKVVIADRQNTATCGKMVYDHRPAGGIARLIGTGESPARMDLADGEKIVCAEARFENATGTARLKGPGRLLQPAESHDESETSTSPTTAPTTAPGGQRYDYIAFGGEVEARFERSEGGGRQLREALFTGGVELARADSEDLLTSDRLHVQTARDDAGSLYVHQAVATGSVNATQGGDRIQADKATLWLTPQREPQRLLAEGNVRISADADADEEPTVARADKLEAWPDEGRAVLTGKASVSRGTNALSGGTIALDDRNQTLQVPGSGTLEFTFDRDLSGEQLSEPMPGTITWRDSMTYNGDSDEADFRGDVKLDSRQDHMECGHMRIHFMAADSSQPSAATRAGDEADRDDGLALRMADYSDRRIRRIVARDDVLLLSRRTDQSGSLLRRMQLRGARLNYDVPEGKVNVYEPGTLLVEDYRPPRGASGGGGVERPYQTLFAFEESMQLSQSERVVVMTGNVRMVHLSGQKLAERSDLLENVPHPEWPADGLPAGRRAALACEELMARFAEADDEPTPGEADETGGPRIGALDVFTASKDVNLRINESQIQGERLMYHRANDLAVVWGYLEGERPARAQIDYEAPDTGRRTTVRSSRITAFLRDGEVYRVETGPAEASGGR